MTIGSVLFILTLGTPERFSFFRTEVRKTYIRHEYKTSNVVGLPKEVEAYTLDFRDPVLNAIEGTQGDALPKKAQKMRA